ncbi:glycoside hydrolase family protein [Vibrio sp.]|uniref:glycoside hydrolase family protein n=1 Tax=Vibrio sp. TaxID=678 RepID=UPI00311E1E3B
MDRQNVYQQLKIDEGVEYEVYLDHLGYPTLGVGHLIKEGEPEHGADVGTKVSEERVFELFEQDLDLAISECVALYGMSEWDEFPGEVKEILVNMMFNMGRTRLSKFRKMNAHLVCGEWASAAVEGRDSRWYRQVTNRAERLMTRMENV